jgi:outer membrane protein assembly factor BamB
MWGRHSCLPLFGRQNVCPTSLLREACLHGRLLRFMDAERAKRLKRFPALARCRTGNSNQTCCIDCSIATPIVKQRFMQRRNRPANNFHARRRWWYLVPGLVVCALTCVKIHAEDWPRWRGPRGDGTWQGPELPERWPDDGLPQIWRRDLEAGYAGIAVVGNRVYTLDRKKEPAETEGVVCLDLKDGTFVWQHRYAVRYGDLAYGNGPRSTPTIHEGRVYTLGTVGHLYCLEAATGKTVWSKDLVQEFGARIPEWGLAASPLIYRDLVIVHCGASPEGCLMAFNRQSGAEIWRASGDPAGYCTPILIEQDGRELLVAWTPENVVGVTPRNGEIAWSIPYKVTYGVSIATPIYAEGLVFVSGYWEGSKAIQLDPTLRRAELAWEDNRNFRGLMSQPLYRDGYVYLLEKQHGLTCFELKSGKKLWDDGNRLTPRSRNPQANLVWLGDTSRVIALNAEGELILASLSPEGYDEQSRTRILGPTWAHPAFAGRRVVARDDKEIVCVELPVQER